MAGAGVEQMFYTLQAGMFYTLQAGLWRGDCGGNALHLHLICANNDDSHAARQRADHRWRTRRGWVGGVNGVGRGGDPGVPGVR